MEGNLSNSDMNCINQKLIKDYQIYVVDMDGTLYYKYPMRLSVLFQMVGYYLFHITNWKEILFLKDYRHLRESEELLQKADCERRIRFLLSQKYHFAPEKVNDIIEEWMYKRPLSAVFKSRDKKLLAFLKAQQQNGHQLYLYSDYPLEDKSRIMGIDADGLYYPDNVRFSFLKPNPEGLSLILRENNLSPADVLMIGDRQDKDGQCAINAGTDYLILKSTFFARCRQYKKWSI